MTQLAWRVVGDDYRGPYGCLGRSIHTPPGTEVADREGIFACTQPLPACLRATVAPRPTGRQVTAGPLRVIVVAYAPSDVIGDPRLDPYTGELAVIRLRRLVVVDELEPNEVAELADGADPEPVIARLTGNA